MDFIETQAAAHPELAERYGRLGELFSRKLWHQLTAALSEFLSDDSNRRGRSFVDLYENFISKIEGKLNQLEFAKMVGIIAQSFPEPQATFQFFEATLERRNRLGVEATLYLEILLLLAKLTLAAPGVEERAATLAEIKGALTSKRVEVDALQGLMDPCVHSAYYQLATQFHKEVGPPEAYYKSALMLIAYTPMDSLKPEQALALATDMSLAALSGDGLYNFGEVLATPIVSVLEGTPNHWLGDLLRCFNRGDMDEFNTILERNREAYNAQPALQMRHEFVKEKLALLAFMNFVFETPSHERTITFADIASRTKLPLDKVEWLVMRSMSLGLIKGVLDEVDGVVHVQWVQPRVLDSEQLKHLVLRLGEWSEKVTATSRFLEDETLELLGS